MPLYPKSNLCDGMRDGNTMPYAKQDYSFFSLPWDLLARIAGSCSNG